MKTRILTYPCISKARFCWFKERSFAFESSWSLLHKFGLWNVVGRTDIINFFAEPAVTGLSRQSPFSRLYTILQPHWICIRRLREACPSVSDGEDRRSAFIEFYLGSSDARITRANCALDVRYCPACFERGYHSPLFQLLTIEHCPLHSMALRAGCPRCRAPIPYVPPCDSDRIAYGCVCGNSFLQFGDSALRAESIERGISLRLESWQQHASPLAQIKVSKENR